MKPFQLRVPLLVLMPEAHAATLLAESPVPQNRLEAASALGFGPAGVAVARRLGLGAGALPVPIVSDEQKLSMALQAIGALGQEARLRAGLALAELVFWVYEHESHCSARSPNVPNLIHQTIRALDFGLKADLAAIEAEVARLRHMHAVAREGEERHVVAAFTCRASQRDFESFVADDVVDILPDAEWPPRAEVHLVVRRYLAQALLPWLLEGDWRVAEDEAPKGRSASRGRRGRRS